MSDDHAVRWADKLDRVLSEEAADECQRFALAHGLDPASGLLRGEVFEDGAVVACDAASVKRYWASDTVEWRAPAKIAAFASFEATVAVGLTNGEVWLLDAATLAPLRSVFEVSEVGVASVALSRDVLVVGDAEGVVVAFDL